MVQVMDQRVYAGLAFGLAGLSAGVGGALADDALPGLLAGACALTAAGVGAVLGATLHRRTADLAEAEERIAALRVENADLKETSAAGEEAVRVAGSFAEMVAQRNLELARIVDGDSLFDEASGLLNARYFSIALQSRVAGARRLLRPLTVVLLELEALSEDANGAAVPFAGVVRETLREADTACRLDSTCFGLILEDTPEGGGVWAAERIRTALARQGGAIETLSAGVASYPSHALDAEDLLDRARRALSRARSSGRGRVEVAPLD